jgi:signal transduction histidine kinase
MLVQWLGLCTSNAAPWIAYVPGIASMIASLVAIWTIRWHHGRLDVATASALVFSAVLCVAMLSAYSQAPGSLRQVIADGTLLCTAAPCLAWAALGSRARLFAPALVVVALATWLVALHPSAVPVEQAVAGLGSLVVARGVTKVLHAGAVTADHLEELAAQDRLATSIRAQTAEQDERARERLHDQVIHALKLVADGSGIEAPAGTGQRMSPMSTRELASAVAVLQVDDDGRDVPATAFDELLSVDELAAVSGAAVSVAGTPDLVVPASAARAVRASTLECMRNVRRHANATRVDLCVTAVDGLAELSISDDGLGFDEATHVAGYGLTRVAGRMTAIGGTCSVAGKPGRGTIVRLSWPTAAVETSPKMTEEAAWAWVSHLGLAQRGVWSKFFAPQLLPTPLFAALHPAAGWLPALQVAVIALQIVLSIRVASYVARLRLGGFVAGMLGSANLLVLAIGVGVVPHGTADGFGYWAIGGGCPAVLAIALLRPAWEGVGWFVATVLVAVGPVSSSSIGGALGAGMVLLTALVLALAIRRSIRRLGVLGNAHHEALVFAQDARVRSDAAFAAEGRRLAPVRRRVLPLLEEVLAAERVDLDTAARAAALSRWARQRLDVPGLLDDALDASYLDAVARGVTVECARELRSTAFPLVRSVLREAFALPRVRRVNVGARADDEGVQILSSLAMVPAPGEAEALDLAAALPGAVVTVSGRGLTIRWNVPHAEPTAVPNGNGTGLVELDEVSG